jgi:hypothetical protein
MSVTAAFIALAAFIAFAAGVLQRGDPAVLIAFSAVPVTVSVGVGVLIAPAAVLLPGVLTLSAVFPVSHRKKTCFLKVWLCNYIRFDISSSSA